MAQLRVPRRPSALRRLLMALGGLCFVALLCLLVQKGINSSGLVPSLRLGTGRSSGGGRTLAAGSAQVGLEAASRLDPELLRQLWRNGLHFRNDERRFLQWTKDVGLLRLDEYRDYAARATAETLPEVDPQQRPLQGPDLSRTSVDLKVLRQAWTAAGDAGSELQFVQWMGDAELLTEEGVVWLTDKLRHEESAAEDAKRWDEIESTFRRRREKQAATHEQHMKAAAHP